MTIPPLDDTAAARAWFTEIVEPLADSFDPVNVDRYVQLFSAVLEYVDPCRSAREMTERYARIRQPRLFTGPDPREVFVLSRVTLGADIAITSVMLDAAKRRFPHARVWFVGSAKVHELFAADPRIGQAGVPYDRVGSVRDRISASQSLSKLLDRPGATVIDPDSRLTQLGLVPVCAESQYYFFESRGLPDSGTLSELAACWAERTFGIDDARAFIAPPPVETARAADIAVSLGVGENPSKRVADPFERKLMEALSATGRSVLVDKGAGGEEAERVVRATAGLPNIRLFHGSFASFAARIATSRGYVGYDSSGQHAAAACGVPLVAIFAGYPNERFLERWRPSGPATVTVLRAQGHDPIRLVEQVISIVRGFPTPADTRYGKRRMR